MTTQMKSPVVIAIALSFLSPTSLISAFSPRVDNGRSILNRHHCVLSTSDHLGNRFCRDDSRKLFSVPLQSATAAATTNNDNYISIIPLQNDASISGADADNATALPASTKNNTIPDPDNAVTLKNEISKAPIGQQKQHSIHLISLPPKDDSFLQPSEKLVRDCWRWKDTVLGDGRDYFVPRPRALKAFQGLFVGMEIEIFYTKEEFGSRGGGMITGNPNDMRRSSANENNVGVEANENKVSFCPWKVSLKMPSFDKERNLAFIFHIPPESQNSNNYQMPLEPELTSESFIIEECAALSNCARLDVILVLRRKTVNVSNFNSKHSEAMSMEAAKTAALYAVANNLEQQVKSQQSKPTSFLQRSGFSSWFDLPGAVDTDILSLSSTKTATTKTNITATRTSPILQLTMKDTHIIPLAYRLTSLEGAPSIIHHLALVAGGLSPRPNRPDREVIFRPYSSRDAHILLQLKRTVDVVSILNGKTTASSTPTGAHAATLKKANKNSENKAQRSAGSGGGGRIKLLLEWALNAGKAVRNEAIVPQIRELKEYGSDGTPPVRLANKVAAVSSRFYFALFKMSLFSFFNLRLFYNCSFSFYCICICVGGNRTWYRTIRDILH